MVLRPVWIVAFSGHRPNSEVGRSPTELQNCASRIRHALAEFQRKSQALGGSIEFISSAADGADLIAIEVAESMGLPIHIILPLPVAEFAVDFREQPAAWNLALSSIAKSGGLIDFTESEISSLCRISERELKAGEWPPNPKSDWTFRIAEGTHERNDCYYDCGTQMLQAADALIVVWNQQREGGLGGTRDVIDQAQALGVAMAAIDSTSHQPVVIEWNEKPWVADPMLLAMHSASLRSGQNAQSSEQIDLLFSSLDDVANRTGGLLKNRVTTIIALQFLATILAAFNSALLIPNMRGSFESLGIKWDTVLIGSKLLLGIQLILVATAFLLQLISRWLKLKSTWQQTRFGAEVLRGLIHTRHLVDPLFPIVTRYNPIWHRFALSSGLMAIRGDEVKAVDWEHAKADYHRDRIEAQSDAYFRRLLIGASRLSMVCGKVGFWSGTLAPICLLFALYLKFTQPSWISNSLWSPLFGTLLPILLPLLAGTSTSLKVVTDAGRRAERYKTQVERLQAISRWIPTLKTPFTIRRAVDATEEILLDELIEWHAASKNTGK